MIPSSSSYDSNHFGFELERAKLVLLGVEQKNGSESWTASNVHPADSIKNDVCGLLEQLLPFYDNKLCAWTRTGWMCKSKPPLILLTPPCVL
jgi:hypothetical protein